MEIEPTTTPSALGSLPPSTLRPKHLTFFSHGLATLSLVATLPSPLTESTTLTFTPSTHHLHDILKTLVVFADNADVTSITYPLNDSNVAPSAKEGNLDIDFEEALLDLLQAAVGTRVSLTHPFRPGNPEISLYSSVHESDNGVCTGVLVGLQTLDVPVPKEDGRCSYGREQFALVRSPSGQLRKLLVRAISDVSFEDPTMDRRLTDALKRKKRRIANAETAVTITISPKDQQEHDEHSTATTDPSEVSVRYAVESPVYKLTHRLIVPDTSESIDPSESQTEEGKILLQAWAIIDSPFPHDLHDISVSLIAGKPMSFRYDLASRRYINRPEETVDTGPGYGKPSLGRTYLAHKAGRRRKPAGLSVGGTARAQIGGSEQPSTSSGDNDEAEDAVAMAVPQSQMYHSPPGIQELRSASIQGVDVAEVGELYEYRIPHRVALRANESALLPVISREVEGNKVLIYAKDVHERYALSAVRLVNSGESTIEKGPVAVYEADLLAGEGMLDSLIPGKQALMPYAIDASASVHSKSVNRPGGLVRVLYLNGWLKAERWQEFETTYKIENSGRGGRMLYLFHKRSHGYEEGDVKASREDDSAIEVSSDTDGGEVKYKLTLTEGCTTLRVVDRSKNEQKYQLESSCTTHAIALLVSGGVVSNKVAEKMKHIMELKNATGVRKSEIMRLQNEVRRLGVDQERFRKNLKSVGDLQRVNRFQDGSLMDRYLKELEQSEDRLRQLRETIKNEEMQVASLQKEVNELMLAVGEMLEN